LLSEFQPKAVKHRSFIVNDVPEDLYVYAHKNNPVMIISSLLNSIISRSRRSCIRLSAKRYHDIILFRLKDSTTAFTHISNHDWQEVNMLAKKLDGCVIENEIRKEHAQLHSVSAIYRMLPDAFNA
jgi:hypothetical protein